MADLLAPDQNANGTAIFARAKAILLKPAEEWPKIAAEGTSAGAVFVGYVVPLAAIGPVCRFLHGQVFGEGLFGFGYRLGLIGGLAQLVVHYVLALVGVLVVALIAAFLGPMFGGEAGRRGSALKLAGYGATAGFLAGVFSLLPGLGVLGLLGLYSLYLFSLGAAPMMRLEGYELIVGSSVDSQFGPVLLFGTGGQLVEVFKDRALALPPLNATLARRMMERTKIFTALQGVRGRKSVNIAELEQLLVRFSQLVVEQPCIAEIDINPLLVSSERIFALDARVVLHDLNTPEDKLPRPAIRPYPVQYVSPWKLKNKAPVVIRPIRPEDEPLMVKFHETLSEETVYHRYFSALKLSQRVAHERLTRICFNDYDREIALVVEYTPPNSDQPCILGVGRLSKLHGTNEAEFSLLVSDAWHGQGLGEELLKRLVQIGRDEKLDRIVGQILSENQAMLHICKKIGFQVEYSQDNRGFTAVYVTK